MFAFHQILSFRYIRQRWSRAVLVIITIMLGVGMMVFTRTLSQCMTKAAHGAVTPLAGIADLLVSNGEHGVQRDLAEELARARIPGVAEIQPLVITRVSLVDLDNRSAVLLGVDLSSERIADNQWGLETKITNPLAWRPGRKPAMIGTELAKALPASGEVVRVRAAGKVSELAGVGTVDAKGKAAALGGNVLVLRLGDAASLLGKPDAVTRIDVTLAPDADREQARAAITALVGTRAEVRTAEANDQAVHDVMAGLELSFMLGGVGALVVGLFLVYNVLSVTVTERRHDIGILRSLGATRGQVATMFAVEAGLLGLAGSVLGVPVGLALAHVSTGPIQNVLSDIFMPLEAGQVPVNPATIALAIAAGMLTALLAAVVPALRASSQEPADAVRRVPLRHGWSYRLFQIASSGLLVAGGIGCMMLRGQLPSRFGSFGGMVLVLLGILVATPLFAEVAARLLGPLARQFLGIEGRLAADNLARSPGRTGLVIAALAAGVALMLQTAGMTISSEQAIDAWIEQALVADLFVTCNSPIAASGTSQSMDASVGRSLESLPEVARALPVRFHRLDYRDTMVFMIALDAPGLHQMSQTRPGIVKPELCAGLSQPGTALVSENFAALHRVHAGDSLTLRGPRGPIELRVLGTVLDYTWNRGAVFMDRQRYAEQFEDQLVDSFDVYLRPDADRDAVRETILRRWGAEQSLVVMTRPEIRQMVSDMVRRLYRLAYAQQVVVGLVAALGVVTALLISVLQRRRELGLLRAVGASRGQVLRSVLAEAILMGVTGSLIGLLMGLPLEWYAVRVILLEETGFSFAVLIPWQEAGIVFSLALVVATLAGLGPAVLAMRQHIAEAVAYE